MSETSPISPTNLSWKTGEQLPSSNRTLLVNTSTRELGLETCAHYLTNHTNGRNACCEFSRTLHRAPRRGSRTLDHLRSKAHNHPRLQCDEFDARALAILRSRVQRRQRGLHRLRL